MLNYLLLLAISTLIYIAIFFRRRWQLFNTFKRIGIPGPKPSLIYGNYPEVYKHGITQAYLKWLQDYGSIVGIYLGAKPLVLVKDPEFIKILQVKEYENFSKRDLYIDGGMIPGDTFNTSIIFGDGQKWKTFRNLLTPAFNTSKMKQIVNVWNATVDRFFEHFDKIPNKENGVEVFEPFRQITVDSIMKVAHSLNPGVVGKKDDHFLQSSFKFFQPKYRDFVVTLAFLFPEFLRVIKFYNYVQDALKDVILHKPSTKFVIEYFYNFLNHRRIDETSKNDVFQRMLDGRYEDKTLGIIKDVSKLTDEQSKKSEIENHSLVADAGVFLLAGSETTSILLSYMCYELAKDQAVQNKLRQELKDQLGNRNIRHDDFIELPYLDQVVNETLRIHPSTSTFVMRKNFFEYTYKGITYPKDTLFLIPISALQIDPEYWVEPMKFDPDRFSPERKQTIGTHMYQPFGSGPRNCIGERYGLKIAKTAFSRLIQRYRFELCADSPKNIEHEYTLFLSYPKGGVHLKVLPVEETTEC